MAESSFDSSEFLQPQNDCGYEESTEHVHEAKEVGTCPSTSSGFIEEGAETSADTSKDENYPSVSGDDPHDDEDDDAVPSNDICVGNTDGETDLIKAVRLNHCDKIRQLIRSGVDCNALCKWDGVPCTVRVEREEFRKQLQMMGYAPLHVAVIHSSMMTVKCLLGMGADIHIKDKNERTALQLAVAVNRPKVARLLINSGAEINTRSVSGRSPLLEAVSNVSLDLTQTLLKAGADPDLTDIKGTTPLSAVIVTMVGDTKGSAPLSAANVTMGRPERGRQLNAARSIVQSLIDAGCEVDRCNPGGASALMLASGMKVTSILPVLIKAGANVNLADRAGRTSFSMAIEGQRNVTTVKELMKYGAATHIADNKGLTPLSKALKFGSVSVLRLLLSADAAPHTYDILTAPRIVQLRQFLPEFDAWLHEELYEPRRLMRLCREVIRTQMSPHNLQRVESLGLPRTLNDFVLGATD